MMLIVLQLSSIFQMNNYWYKIQIFFILLLCLHTHSSCNSSTEKNSKNNAQEIQNASPEFNINDTIEPGNIYEHILINNDYLNSFAIYLPRYYSTKTSWPIVFFFDSGGNGSLPIKKYKTIADSLGFILVGSNASKNGQDFRESQQIWYLLKNACLNNFKINKNAIVLCGFSGGARVSCSLAEIDKSVLAVIANSAGAQQLNQKLSNNSLFIGLSGKGDMNRAEMLNIEYFLEATALPHYYIEFKGKHEWAPLNIFKKALQLTLFHAFRQSIIDTSPEIVSDFITEQLNDIKQLELDNNLVEAYNQLVILNNGVKDLSTLSFPSPDSLAQTDEYIAQKNKLMRINLMETEIQKELTQIIQTPDNFKAWKEKIELLKKEAKKNNDLGAMNQRLLGYASLLSYSLSNRYLQSRNYQAAKTMIDCYEVADPENAEVYFFKAIVNSTENKPVEAIENIKKSLKLNLTDKNRILKQPEFTTLKGLKAFDEVERQLNP